MATTRRRRRDQRVSPAPPSLRRSTSKRPSTPGPSRPPFPSTPQAAAVARRSWWRPRHRRPLRLGSSRSRRRAPLSPSKRRRPQSPSPTPSCPPPFCPYASTARGSSRRECSPSITPSCYARRVRPPPPPRGGHATAPRARCAAHTGSRPAPKPTSNPRRLAHVRLASPSPPPPSSPPNRRAPSGRRKRTRCVG